MKTTRAPTQWQNFISGKRIGNWKFEIGNARTAAVRGGGFNGGISNWRFKISK
jgi:hypothetical protein